MGDEIKLVGQWKTVLRGPQGEIKETRDGHNIVCDNGKEFLASFMNSAVAAASTFTMRYIAIGTDTTAEAASNTALGAEASRHTGTVSYISNQIFQVKATFATGSGTGAITEYGLFSSSTGGTLLNRDTEDVINKGASDTLEVTMQLTLS